MSATATITSISQSAVPLGLSVPPSTPHAISVSLPTWEDNVGYEEGQKRVMDTMVNGYPRFFIHLSIRKLAAICEQKFATREERCLLFPTQTIADWCRAFIQERSTKAGSSVSARLVYLDIRPEHKLNKGTDAGDQTALLSSAPAELHIVLFPADSFSLAKEFWQHTGMGISSRLAEHCLSMLPIPTSADPTPEPSHPKSPRFLGKVSNKHYSSRRLSKPPSPKEVQPETSIDDLTSDHSAYLEERYGRNLPLSLAESAKRAMRRRISGTLLHDDSSSPDNKTEVGPSTRGVAEVSEDDVYLYPTGMSAIWNAHNLARNVRPLAKSVCFGFPYTDTLKVLQKWGPGCHFLGHGLDSDLDELEAILQTERARDPTTPPALALFTEFPSNPLLRSANLPRLRQLADKYDFLIIIDETIGNIVNVEVFPYADAVVSSLSKVFCGYANAMGGSLVLNPKGRHYGALKAFMNKEFQDFYFDQDAIFMERNSREFRQRIKAIDGNAEAVCDYLQDNRSRPDSVIKDVFYPKFVTPENYEICRIKEGGGYGGLFSVTFKSLDASKAFFDALEVHKGPSLGTNFTLACPYTIIAHFAELEWVAQYGVEAGLVRISVGQEDPALLLEKMRKALDAAEAAVRSA